MGLNIRPAVEGDFESIWRIFRAVVATGTTYTFDPDTPREQAHAYWLGPGIRTFVAEDEDQIAGMYKLVPNQVGFGSHVANASFMVDPELTGKGTGRLMGMHCLHEAKRAGFLAMQFNYVVSTNAAAVELWKSLGFSIVGTLPKAFHHRELGYVDVYVMHRFLDSIP